MENESGNEVLMHIDAGLAIITINRPAARNAINHAVAVGLASVIDEMESRPDVVIGIITGAGGTFCAGMDLKAFLAGEDMIIPGRGLAGICERPPRKPVIAAVEGWALAGGCEVALACDLMVAASDARFGLPETKRGLIAAAGGLLRLPRRIPPAVAMEYALTGEAFSAEVAHRYGLVNRLTEPGRALEGAKALAAQIRANGPLAVAATKEIVSGALDDSLEAGFVRQQPLLEAILGSADAREGAAAFAEKRAPEWTGR
ncbi:crotonase/enoyl-CoA hydratase family protein [Pseudonocardia xishanensis]|uniref:Crotonase/enoyl-CoA hydratase family protein n=1 Tax=Pseudonocardia xishanensis TaxID=630995 RepID=A0ABP8RYF3_9PSEU